MTDPHARLAPIPPRGWNSFDCLGTVATEQSLMDNLEVFAERLQPAGYDYFVLDAGWYYQDPIADGWRFPLPRSGAGGRDPLLDEYGRPIPAPQVFPNGLRPVIDRCHALGLKFGIHIMRGIPRKAVHENLPIRNTASRAADIADTTKICLWSDLCYGVDTTKPDGQAYYDSLFEMLAEWEVDFVKADDLVPHPDEIHAIADALERCGRPMVLSLSPGGLVAADHFQAYRRAHMVRITKDIWDRVDDIHESFSRWYTWQGTERPGFWLDLDMIPFGRLSAWRPPAVEGVNETEQGRGASRMSALSEGERRVFITQRALAASPLFMGGHLPETDDYSFALLTNPRMLACNANGVCGRFLVRRRGWWVWHVADRQDPGHGWFGVFNMTDRPLTERLLRRQVGLAEGDCAGHDIWADRELPLDGDLTVDVPPHDVLFVEYAAR